MTRKPFVLALVGACALALTGVASAQNRVSSTQKGSVLIFSKVEIKWSADGQTLLQDTFLDVSNDYPADVSVQAYFINGDEELEEVMSQGMLIQAYEPGWNTADCRFTLTANQPHFWSAANGSSKCQAFPVLDPDGPGRPDPETGMTSRILRGYVVMWAVYFDGSSWVNIRWNHLKGDAVIVNYENGSAWEYNAWAFQARTGSHGAAIGDGENIYLNGGTYDAPFANLLLDFYASGSQALSGGGQTVMVDTDVTLHAVSVDLRQDGCGPVLTKVEAEIWNEFETKFSGTRRCICCWDQTMLSDWVRSVAIPNHFTRERLGTDKGQARLTGVESNECNYAELCGPTGTLKRRICEGYGAADTLNDVFPVFEQSEDAALLGLATKFLSFSPSGDHASAGMNLVGAGTGDATIQVDPMVGPEESNDDRTGRATGKTLGSKGLDVARDAAVRVIDRIPAE
jgi:hypothetical protein